MRKICIMLPFAALILVETAHGQSAPGLDDLVGARAPGAENAMRSRGYELVRSSQGDDRSYTYWWNGASNRCVTVATMEGRYNSVVSTPAPDCGKKSRASAERYAGNGRDRDGQNPPDIGYRNSMSVQRQSPSYVEDRNRGGDRYQVGGNDVDIGLVCFGDGQRPGVATSYGWSWNSRTNRYDYGNRTEMTGQQFDASLMIQLWANGGRIRLPKKLVPPINSRGNDGWWDLYDVAAEPDIIRAKYRLNGLNKPAITINRRSGQISIQGTAPYAFRGTCDAIDGEDHRKF